MRFLLLMLIIVVGAALSLAVGLTLYVLSLLNQHGIDLETHVDLNKDYKYTEVIRKELAATGIELLILEDPQGNVELEGWSGESLWVEVTKKADTKEALERMRLDIEAHDHAVQVRTYYPPDGGKEEWLSDYTIKVPFGLAARVEIKQKVGKIRIHKLEGLRGLSIELGVGKLKLEGVQAPSIAIDMGVGEADFVDIEANSIQVDVGVGDLELFLPLEASYLMEAKVDLGELQIRGFPQIERAQKGFLSQRAYIRLGKGEGEMNLHVGVGNITVRPLSPVE